MDADLDEADFGEAIFDHCIFGDLDLSKVKGLDKINHMALHTLDIDTIIQIKRENSRILSPRLWCP